ncbi:MAG TPA: YeeE/YedE thiosulfate transporter family protein [Flavobacteriales bacterium]|nr:YeeE/YedE thiosulfate transporter family protein [Flavobacteriales bacterium]
MQFLLQPWPWYVTGPLIGLMVPLLLIFGNKAFGISVSLKHICAACIPSKNPFFKYDWRKETWNLVFALGIVIGGFLAWNFAVLHNKTESHVAQNCVTGKSICTNPIYNGLNPEARLMFKTWGITEHYQAAPEQIFDWNVLVTPMGFFFMVLGGLLVGFGTVYAGGCTSGHSIMGISQLSPASMIATAGFFIGGLISSWFIVPFLLEQFLK